jgi:hypothetical protein
VLYTRVFEGVIAPAEHAFSGHPDCPQPLALLWRSLCHHIDDLAAHAGLGKPTPNLDTAFRN